MAGKVFEVLMVLVLVVVDEKRGSWLVVLLITFGVLTVASRAVLMLARTVVIMLVLRVVLNVRGGAVPGVERTAGVSLAGRHSHVTRAHWVR